MSEVQYGEFVVGIEPPPPREEVVAQAIAHGYPDEYAQAHADLSLACYGKPVHVILPLIHVQVRSCIDQMPTLEMRNEAARELRRLADSIDAGTMQMLEDAAAAAEQEKRDGAPRPLGPQAKQES